MLRENECIEKQCSWCKEVSLHSPTGRYCRICIKLRTSRYRENNLEKVKSKERNRVLSGKKAQDLRAYVLRTYNLTIEDYKKLFDLQNGLCAICNLSSVKNLAVDHCHITGKVRGLLCAKCNMGIGAFEDKTSNIFEAINYLNKSLKNE